MALRSTFWSFNQRLQNAALNNPPLKQSDPDKEAVTLLQRALADTGIDPFIKVDGIFGAKTAAAVRAVETRFNMDLDSGEAGRQTLGILDILLQGGRLGADLARSDTGLAGQKVLLAILNLSILKESMLLGIAPPLALTVNALRTHFRLTSTAPTIGVTRQFTIRDIDTILTRYENLNGLYAASAARFRTGVPVNGINTAAEAPINGPVTFGPAYTDVDSHFGDRIGPNSRAAVVIHEGVHVFDPISGLPQIHISEFQPAYDIQSADLSLHNPSSFAGLSAHIFNGSDPQPRFGLGDKSRGL